MELSLPEFRGQNIQPEEADTGDVLLCLVFLFLCQSSSIHPTAEGSKLQFSATMFLRRWGTSIHPLLLIYCFLPIKMIIYSILVENYIPLSFSFFILFFTL